MTRSECAQEGEVEEGSGASWDSLLGGELGMAGEEAAIIRLPLKEYLRSRRRLNHERIYFPLGYPVRVVSNSQRVLDAAEQSWSGFGAMFHGEPLEILLEVISAGDGGDALPPAPAYLLRESLMVQIADAKNFYIADLKWGRAMGRVTPVAARCPGYLRYFFLESAALCMISAKRAVPVHAACVRAGSKGVLLCGDSGDGKTTLAYAGARSGWTYVSDDASYFPMGTAERLALGNCAQMRFRPSGVALFPELAGRPVTPRAAGKPSIEVRTSEWPEMATASATRVDHVVFLNRHSGDTQELVSLRTSSVMPWFRQHLISPPGVRPAQEATLERLLSGGVFELRYHDLGWAIDRINELSRKGN